VKASLLVSSSKNLLNSEKVKKTNFELFKS
jgi:hypothetical protein